jgi:hypothetical protein
MEAVTRGSGERLLDRMPRSPRIDGLRFDLANQQVAHMPVEKLEMREGEPVVRIVKARLTS